MTVADDVEQFIAWFQHNGGQLEKNVKFVQVPSGFSLTATAHVPSETSIVSCPFSLTIGKETATGLLLRFVGAGSGAEAEIERWTARQAISCYLCLHWAQDIAPSFSDNLLHTPYVRILPSRDKLRTALHFSSHERELFKGTNMYGAIVDREQTWRAEWSQCQKLFGGTWNLIWEDYLTAATYISSRAFPSSILSSTPTLISSESTEPVLLPGVDSLNHARGQPVTWEVNKYREELSISLVVHRPTESGAELFNNYGPKPNSELILGYGFSLENNPDDTIVLKVGGGQQNTKKWEIGRHAAGMEGLWNELLSMVSQDDSPADGTYEDQLDAASLLDEMTESLLSNLPHPPNQPVRSVRPEILLMFQHYIEGQRDILESVRAYAAEKQRLAIGLAKSQGVELVIEDE